jgi:xanthine dehydrogenase small subunit
VTKFLRPIGPGIFIGHLMKDVAVSEAEIRIGAGVTYSEFLPVVGKHLPEAEDYLLRIGGWQVRNAGRIGGNIANGSPIGETPPLLIALGARIVLRRGSQRREIALEDFFIAYGKQDRAAGEFVETIIIPRPRCARIAAYKVSKRACGYFRGLGRLLHPRGAWPDRDGADRVRRHGRDAETRRAGGNRARRPAFRARNVRGRGDGDG